MNRSELSRRDLLRLLGGSMLTPAVAGYGTQRARAAEGTWPQFGHDARKSSQGPSHTGPTTGVGERWCFQTGDRVESSLAVVDETVYVGSGDNNVYALSAEDGREQWRFETGDRVESSPAVVNGTVYVGSFDTNVYALSAEDGSEQWRFETDSWVTASPAVADGTVYVGGEDKTVYALSAEEGNEQWRFETGRPVKSSPAVVNGTVYVGNRDNSVYALSAEDGGEQWRFQTGDRVESSPVVVDGTVYIGSFDTNVYALDEGSRTVGSAGVLIPWTDERTLDLPFGYYPHGESVHMWEWQVGAIGLGLLGTVGTGKVAVSKTRQWWSTRESTVDPLTTWRSRGRGSTNTSAAPERQSVRAADDDAWTVTSTAVTAPVHTGTAVVVGTTEGTLLTVDPITAEATNCIDIGDERPTALVATADTVVAACEGTLHSIAVDDGTVEWTEDSQYEIASPLAIYRGNLYSGRADGSVRARDASDGTEQWQTTLDDAIVRGPAVDDDHVVVATESELVMLGRNDGEQRWTVDLDSKPATSPVIGEECVYIATADGAVQAVDFIGVESWSLATDTTPSDRLVVTADAIYVAGENGTVVAVSPDGTERWRTSSSVGSTVGPVVIGDRLFRPTGEQILSHDLDNGDIQRSVQLPGTATGVAPTSNALYAGTADGLAALPNYKLEAENWGKYAGTDNTSDDETADAETDREPDDQTATVQSPDTAAGQFAQACPEVQSARPIDEDNPVHVYEGRLHDGAGDVQFYALAPEHSDTDAADAFARAAQQWSGISHNPHIAAVVDSGREPRPWVAFEAGEGSLRETVDDVDRSDRLHILDDIIEGLKTANLYNVAHGTLDPETVRVVLAEDSDDPTVMLTDWGLTRSVQAALETPQVTPYTAPEQLDGGTASTTDSYRVGLLAEWLLTDQPPYGDADDLTAAIRTGDRAPPSAVVDLPDQIDDVIARATAPDPGNRYDSVVSLRGDIRGALP